jgi:RNA polymerase sigma-70 factor, ECF subfamily
LGLTLQGIDLTTHSETDPGLGVSFDEGATHPGAITTWLKDSSAAGANAGTQPGNGRAATDQLAQAIYDTLKARAGALLRGERAGHTLTPTALVHEAYLRLIELERIDWKDRVHFFAVAARMMRRVLVNHAIARQADKRGAGAEHITLGALENAAGLPQDVQIERLNTALDQLEAQDERQARIVELKYFAGLEIEEIAAALDISPATVKRDWAVAKLWLARAMRHD